MQEALGLEIAQFSGIMGDRGKTRAAERQTERVLIALQQEAARARGRLK